MAKVEDQVLETIDPISEQEMEHPGKDDVKKVTAKQLREMGFSMARTRKPVDYSADDPGKNAKIKLTQYKAEAIAAYKKIMRLADRKFSHDGKDYPVKVSENQRRWVMDALVELHAATDIALETGVRPTVVTESCPD